MNAWISSYLARLRLWLMDWFAQLKISMFSRPHEDNIVRLRAALKRVYPEDQAIDEVTYTDLAGEYPAIRYNAPDGFSMDILSRLGTAWTYDDIEYEALEFEGVPIPVATPAMLYRMKKDTLRWKDKFDAEALRQRFGLED